MSGLIVPSDNMKTTCSPFLADLHKCSRDAGDALMKGNQQLAVHTLLRAYKMFNSYAVLCAFSNGPFDREEMKRWDSAFAAITGLSISVMREKEFIEGLVEILQGGNVSKRSDTLYIVASGGEYRYRTLFVTLAVGVLCSLFYPTVVHGNRSVTGCGCGKFAESDILECLTGKNSTPFPDLPEKNGIDAYVQTQLARHNFGFAYTQAAFPLFWRFAAARGEAGLRDALKLAGTITPPIGSKYAYVGLWTSGLFDVARPICDSLYEDYVLVAGPYDHYDELGSEGGTVCYKGKDKENVARKVLHELKPDLAETKDQDRAKDEIDWLGEIMTPGALVTDNPRTRNRLEIAVVNAAYALSVLPQYEGDSIDSIMDKLRTKISNGAAAEKLGTLKALSFWE